MLHILTTRFNIETFEENRKWKERKKIKTCGYGLIKPIPNNITRDTYVYVIEMINNKVNDSLPSKNKLGEIGGIGYVKNHYYPNKRSRIYGDDNYNRYVYIGEKYITRNDIIKKFGDEIVLFLEKILFTGSRHFKRGSGMTRLSLDRIAIHDNIINKSELCDVCGLIKKGHTCSGIRQRPQDRKNKCPFCNKSKKGNGGLAHICKAFKRDEKQLEKVLRFFRNLFNNNYCNC